MFLAGLLSAFALEGTHILSAKSAKNEAKTFYHRATSYRFLCILQENLYELCFFKKVFGRFFWFLAEC